LQKLSAFLPGSWPDLQLHQQTEKNKRLTATLNIEQQEKITLTERITSFEARRIENQAEERLHQLL